MRKALFLSMVTVMALSLLMGCAKKPADVIVGDWEGEVTMKMPEGEREETMEFTSTFNEDGTCTFKPVEEEEAAEGTYEITETGEVTAMVTMPDEQAVELTGKLDMETESLELSGIVPPPEEQIKTHIAQLEQEKMAAEEEGEEFTKEIPTKEELTKKLTTTMEFALSKATAGEEETTEE